MGARRRALPHPRIDDLVDPYVPPLGKAYGTVVVSSAPIVVPLARQDIRQAANAAVGTIAYIED